MSTKLQLIVLGVVVLQGAVLSGMDKELKSPRSLEKEQLVVALQIADEIKKEQGLKNKTQAMPIPSARPNNFSTLKYPGNHSPVEMGWIPMVFEPEYGYIPDCP